MTAAAWRYGETSPVIANVLTAQGVAVCDLVGVNSGNLVRAEDETWVTDLATTQTNFRNRFLGASGQRKTAGVAQATGAGAANTLRVDTEGVFEYDCAAATFNVGDLVGPAKDTGNALLSQKVVAVGSAALAIGRVNSLYSSNTTRVRVRIFSKLMAPVSV